MSLRNVCKLAGISVADAGAAFEAAVAHGAVSVQPPTTLADAATGTEQTVAEVSLYGDVVMRFVSGSFQVQSGSFSCTRRPCSAAAAQR